MSSQGRWSIFQHSQPGLPTILVRYVPTSIGYSIKLTDLSRVWEETVNVKEIIQRAEREGCSINPGDDSDQLCILLGKIDTALCRDEDGASAHVERANDADNITLVITAPLPKPLAPLKWRMYLQQAGSEELTTLVVGPLLLLAHQQRNETEYLLEQLRHKDHVISKLLDRMESANLLLDSVFMLPPNVKISKRTPQRQQFAKHVPGLGLYEIGSELKHIGNIPSTDKLCNELGKTPDDHQNSLQAPRNGWWNHIEYGFTNAFKTEASLDLDGEDTDDDEFQTQQIPEHLKTEDVTHYSSPQLSQKPPGQGQVSGKEYDSTDEESTEPDPACDAASRHQSVESLSSTRLWEVHRLGAIGGSQPKASGGPRKVRDMNRPVSPVRNSISQEAIVRATTPPPLASQPDVALIKASPTKRKLGAIGGRQNSVQAPSQTWNRLANPQTSNREDSKIGARQSTPTSLGAQEAGTSHMSVPEPHSRSTLDQYGIQEPEQPQSRETSEERANKKREEKKFILDHAVKVPKKKRKF